MLCVCSAGKPPGKCPTCAPDGTRAVYEQRKLKRKVNGMEVFNKRANLWKKLECAGVAPDDGNDLGSLQRQCEIVDQEKAKTQAAVLTGRLASFGVVHRPTDDIVGDVKQMRTQLYALELSKQQEKAKTQAAVLSGRLASWYTA